MKKVIQRPKKVFRDVRRVQTQVLSRTGTYSLCLVRMRQAVELLRCPLRKRFYVADAAQTNYRSTLTESRRGTHVTDGERANMSDALFAPVKFGKQSIGVVRNIIP